jgi:hypothetical protein
MHSRVIIALFRVVPKHNVRQISGAMSLRFPLHRLGRGITYYFAISWGVPRRAPG